MNIVTAQLPLSSNPCLLPLNSLTFAAVWQQTGKSCRGFRQLCM